VADQAPPPAPPRSHTARIVTDVFGPAILGTVALALTGLHTGHLEGLGWAVLAAALVILPGLTYVMIGVRRGRLSDVHLAIRSQRHAVVAIGVTSTVIGLVILEAVGAPKEVVAVVVAMLAGLILVGLITRWWKISFHTAVAAGTVLVLVRLFGVTLFATWTLVCLVGWARVRLGDHTPAQVLAGAMVGGAVAALVLNLLV
jgi:membrane-associated phospholipid phosphatase